MTEPSAKATGSLAGPDCRAVVIGTGRQPPGALLSDLPAATRSARAVAEALHAVCGMAEENIELLLDPAGPTDVLAAVQRAVDHAERGVVLFCFVGHGLLGPGDHLYLATSATTSSEDTVPAIAYTEVRNRLSAAPVRPVVILDCCFSGLAEAAAGHGQRRDPYASARPSGSYLLTSATHYARSFAPEGDTYTLFSGELLGLLTEGAADGPPRFTLADVYRHLDQRLHHSGARPHADSVGRMGDLVLAANPRYAPPPDSAEHASGTAEGAEADAGPCPYPGMRPFLPEESGLFFGRDELTGALAARLAPTAPPGPVVLVGPSGVGKSSLLQAALAAVSREGGPVLFVPAPGARPFRELVNRWADAVGRPFGEVAADLGAGRFPAPADGRPAPGVLVVDQAEELFTHREEAEEYELFVRAVTAPGDRARERPRERPRDPAQDPAPGPRVVLALRADYYAHCLREPRLARAVREGHFTVPSMSDAELRQAIEGPARHVGLALEPGLPELLLRELREQSTGPADVVALPFLAHALQQTWTRRRAGRLTVSGYHATGGIRGSVARTADRIHDAATADEQAALRRLLLRLVRLVDEEGKAVRRRVGVDDLTAAADEEQHRRHEALLALLVEERLVVVDDRNRAQLCHDSLLHGWPTLREWIKEDLDALLVRRRLGESADAWAAAGRPGSGLYSRKHLAAVRAATSADPQADELRQVDRDFLAAGISAERRGRNRLRAVIAFVTVLAVTLTGALAWAGRADSEARRKETVELARQLVARADDLRAKDPQTALRLSLAAYRLARIPETRSGLYTSYTTIAPTTFQGTHDPVLKLAYSADGAVLATSLRGGEVALWRVPDRAGALREPVRASVLHLDGSAVVAFHPQRALLVAQTGSRLGLWDVADPARPLRLADVPTAGGNALDARVSPDGRLLATGAQDGALRLWDITDPRHPVLRSERDASHTDLVSLSFHHGGRLLAAGNGIPSADRPAEVRLWDVGDPAQPALLDTATAASVMAVAFQPGGDLLTAAGAGGLYGWTVGPDKKLKEMPAGAAGRRWTASTIPALGFAPDGKTLGAADTALGQVMTCSPTATPEAGKEFCQGHESYSAADKVQSMTYSPDGASIATGDFRGEVRIWPKEPDARSVPGELARPDPGTSPFSSDGSLMITRMYNLGQGSDARLWDVRDRDAPTQRFALPDPWEARYFVPGRARPTLLAHRWTENTKDHVFRLWEFEPAPGRDAEAGTDIAFTAADVLTGVSADGELLAIGDQNTGRVELWDLHDALHPVRRAEWQVPMRLGKATLWFLDTRTMVTLKGETDLQLWDLTDPSHPKEGAVIPKGAEVSGSAYFRTARVLMTEAVGGALQLWDLSDMAHPRAASRLPAASGGYYDAGPHGLVTALSSGLVQFWDIHDPYRPREHDSRRLDEGIKSLDGTSDHAWAVTGKPFQLWRVGQDGRWGAEPYATFESAESFDFLPEGQPYAAVRSNPENGAKNASTYLVELDPDHLYERLCRSHPASVDAQQWRDLFPHLQPRRSCG